MVLLHASETQETRLTPPPSTKTSKKGSADLGYFTCNEEVLGSNPSMGIVHIAQLAER